jgi:hypothetical protein
MTTQIAPAEACTFEQTTKEKTWLEVAREQWEVMRGLAHHYGGFNKIPENMEAAVIIHSDMPADFDTYDRIWATNYVSGKLAAEKKAEEKETETEKETEEKEKEEEAPAAKPKKRAKRVYSEPPRRSDRLKKQKTPSVSFNSNA